MEPKRGTALEPPLIAIGASAGGIEALRTVLPKLPGDLPAAIAVVVHRPPVQDDERLARVLATAAQMEVREAKDGQPVKTGCAYVCPAAVHLVVVRGHLRLTTAAHENGWRPAIDVLFRSTAAAYGPRAAGVVLSGLLDDGTAGLAAIKARGGYTIAQEPGDALFGDMPRNAIESVRVDSVLPAHEIGPALVEFAHRAVTIAPAASRDGGERGEPSAFSCPHCGGVLSQIEADGVVRFRCRTGHAYSPRTLFSEQEEGLESALWAALRALEERADLSDRLAHRYRTRGLTAASGRFAVQAAVARRRAELVRGAMEDAELALAAAAAAADTAAADAS